MARKAAKDPAKSAKKKAPPKKAADGSSLGRIVVALVVLGGVAWGSTVVRIGDRTVLQHGAELVQWERVSSEGLTLARAASDRVRGAFDDEPRAPVAAKAPPAKVAPKKPAAPVARAEKPVEGITAADCDALERLLPR